MYSYTYLHGHFFNRKMVTRSRKGRKFIGPRNKPRLTVAKVNKKVNKLIAATEVKTTENAIDVSVDYDGHIFELAGTTQGLTENTRVGDKIRFTGLRINGMMSNFSGTQPIVRLVIYKDKINSINTIPLLFDALELGTGQAPLSHFNQNNLKAFQVLWDRTFILDNVRQIKVFKKYLKIKFPTTYRSSDNIIMAGSIKLAVIANSSANLPGINLAIKQYFMDN